MWCGRETGVCDSWAECEARVKGVAGARYKSFKTQEEAVEAFRRGYDDEARNVLRAIVRRRHEAVNYEAFPEIVRDSIAVDGACAGNPGMMEYRGVDVMTGAELFHQGPFADGTNNIGEFLALVHALAFFHNTDDGAADIILAGSVKIGHLSRLAADQGAVVLTAGFGKAGDQLLENRGFQFAGADIVQEEERLRAQNSDIIHTVIDQIGTYRVVFVQGKGDLEFGAYAVHAGNQYRLFVLGDFECE